MRVRFRWRKIAVAFVLLLGVVWWFTRPERDPRLLGTWRYDVFGASGEATFHANGKVDGFAFQMPESGSGRYFDAIGWRTEQNQLLLDIRARPKTVQQWVEYAVDLVLGNIRPARYVLLEVTPDLLRFHTEYDEAAVTTYWRVERAPQR